LDPLTEHRALVRRIGVVLQQGGVYPMLGPRRVVELFAGYYRDPVPTDELLSVVGLSEVARTPWRHLSGGEQQRLGLALALIGRPEVAFLDEPTAGVDPEGRVAIRLVIAQLKERGVCVVLTTHELGEAERSADRTVVLHRGRVLAAGTPAELAATLDPRVRFTSDTGLDTAGLGAWLGVTVNEDGPGVYGIEAQSNPRLTAALATWLADHDAPLVELRSTATLEETYLSLVGTEEATERVDAPARRPRRAR
ncbi:MAG: ATP-binding cassette domain-containing protein, partial [Acidimicrobiales bacterium]